MTLHYNRTEVKAKRRALRQSETIAEKNMWSQLRNRQFLGLKFRRQYSVDKYIIDFYCPEYKIAIELDGSIHNLEEVKQNDSIRQKHIEKYGIKFIRITNEEYLGNSNKTFQKIEEEIDKIIKQTEQLRQRILKKSFEGKLVSQDPNDQPASELLEKIKKEKQKNVEK